VTDSLRRLWLKKYSALHRTWRREVEDTHKLGFIGECLAADFLILKRCHILKRDFHPKHGGQVDLVVRDGDALVFVEVKTRRSRDHHRAFFAVSENQQGRIRKSAHLWLRALGSLNPRLRFDILEVYLEAEKKPKCYWFKDAF